MQAKGWLGGATGMLAFCGPQLVQAAPGGVLRDASEPREVSPSSLDPDCPSCSCRPCAATAPAPPRVAKTPAGAERGALSANQVWNGPPRLPPPTPRLADWVRPIGGAYAAYSTIVLIAISGSEPPNLSLSFRHGASALFSSGAFVGVVGGAGTVLAPARHARPLLELTLGASIALQALAAAQEPERGVPAYGEYAAASGYALSSLLVGADWALSPASSMLDVSPRATPHDAPRRAISPYVAYTPAVVGALVSLSRALRPSMSAEDREISLGLGSYALVPAAAGLVMGIVSASRRREPEVLETWVGAGPRGSFGLTLGGSL